MSNKARRLPANSPDTADLYRSAAKHLENAEKMIGRAVAELGEDGIFAEELADHANEVARIKTRLRFYAEQ